MRDGFQDDRFHVCFALWLGDFFHALKHLDTTLDARCGTCFVAKTIDIGFLFFYLAFLYFIMLELCLVAFLLFDDIGVVVSGVDVEFFLRDFYDFLTRVIDKGDIVGDRDDCLFPETAEVFEKDDSLDIEVVRRFIEDEDIDFLDDKFGNLDFHLFTSRELCHDAVEIGIVEAEIGEDAEL